MPDQGNPTATILVVDDHPSNRALAAETLRDEGYAVVLAADGAEALALFASKPPDCVLLDVNMPGMNGFAVCARIRELPSGPATPIVFVTAQRDVETFDSALRAGGDDFLTKPVRPTDLVLRVQAALELRKLRTDLSVQYEMLKKQRDDLMRLQLQKERLSAFIVHDLKNPVGTMDLHAQILLRDASLSPTARDSATRIRASARQLSRMILNLLDLSKGDEGKLVARRTPTELRDLAASVADDLGATAAEQGIRIETRIGVVQANVDADLVRRMLANLVENAIRHAPRDSVVTVSARELDGVLELRVADQGRGIAENLRTKVFEPFVQLDHDSADVTRAGRGLGLAFCRLVVEAHAGSIHVEDASPGAAFCARIPHV